MEDPDAFAACMNGPPSVEKIKLTDPRLTLRQAQAVVAGLLPAYEEAISRGYSILLPRIDFTKRPTLATRLLNKGGGETRDGHALWQIVKQACDFTSDERQEELKLELKNFELHLPGSPVPTPDELTDALYGLQSVWLKIDGNDADRPKTLVTAAVKKLPRPSNVPLLAQFAESMRTTGIFSAATITDYDAFVETLIEQYRAVLNSAREQGVKLTHTGTAAMLTDDDLPDLVPAPATLGSMTQQQLLALIDQRSAPPGGPRPGPREAKPIPPNKCGCCVAAICFNVGSDPTKCVCFNNDLDIPKPTAAQISYQASVFG